MRIFGIGHIGLSAKVFWIAYQVLMPVLFEKF